MNVDAATLIVALFSGGGVAAIITAITSWRKGVREVDVNKEQNALAGFQALAESLRAEIERLKAGRAEDQERMDRIEKEIDRERDLRWVAVQHIRALYAWITQHMPGADPPAVPDALAPHIIITTKKDQP
ncbi:hypothetical protein Bra3105_06845 [Brachybacterium halotolerans subsp. kimchii]|uniref:hypothetical protein n=1 Tax=Brachybacterium halotolerans TaxID=2795215 RepID=UPI001E34BB7E|nr:hypothetical protein [Brachybacterium halotolerans]UEJ84024.1 hypothetical protein Bra3105_06845 [Brachybacterium halotolerans subsp. kimchii]